MYSRKALTEIFQRILKFEEDAKALYDDCIEELDDENTISILRSIRSEEEGHIELAKHLMELIQE